MFMIQGNLLELAKQGNALAIASLINRSLQPKGITAKVHLTDFCLQVMLESPQIPNQVALVEFIQKGLTGLGADTIEKVKVYGRKTGEDFPAWNQEFVLGEQKKATPHSPLERLVTFFQPILNKQSGLNEKAKQADDLVVITQNPPTLKITELSNSIDPSFIGKFIGIIGSIFLCAGIFSPIISLPLIGNLNYLYIKGDSIIILILSIISLIIILQDKYHLLWITGASSLGIVIIDFCHIQILILQIRVGVQELLSQIKFKGLVDVAVNSIQMQWGWFFLLFAIFLIIVGTIVQEKIQINELGYIRYFSKIFDIKTSPKTYLFLGLIFVGIMSIKVVFGQTNLLYTSSNNQLRVNIAKQVQAKDNIMSINLSQQIFYLEHKKFAPTLDKLELAIPTETRNYKYSIINSDDPDNTDNIKTIATAIAKENGLKSYLGYVFIVKDVNLKGNYGERPIKSIACESNQSSKIPPEIVLIGDNKAECPPEYSLLLYP